MFSLISLAQDSFPHLTNTSSVSAIFCSVESCEFSFGSSSARLTQAQPSLGKRSLVAPRGCGHRNFPVSVSYSSFLRAPFSLSLTSASGCFLTQVTAEVQSQYKYSSLVTHFCHWHSERDQKRWWFQSNVEISCSLSGSRHVWCIALRWLGPKNKLFFFLRYGRSWK